MLPFLLFFSTLKVFVILKDVEKESCMLLIKLVSYSNKHSKTEAKNASASPHQLVECIHIIWWLFFLTPHQMVESLKKHLPYNISEQVQFTVCISVKISCMLIDCLEIKLKLTHILYGRIASAINIQYAVSMKCFNMCLGRIALMLGKAVLRKLNIICFHDAISRYLG